METPPETTQPTNQNPASDHQSIINDDGGDFGAHHFGNANDLGEGDFGAHHFGNNSDPDLVQAENPLSDYFYGPEECDGDVYLYAAGASLIVLLVSYCSRT